MGFPGGSEGKASACNAGDSGSIPGLGFPGGTSGKEPACQCRRHKRCGFDPLVKKIPWRRAWQPTPVFLSGKSHGQRSPVGYSPLGCKESDPLGVFSNESTLCIRWPKFSISPSNEYSGLISFWIDWFDLLAGQGSLKSLLQHHSSKASLSLLYGPTLTTTRDY